ncbi:MAG: efflux RND transporter permease subunit [Vulcanimicrobiota bacterium]
MLNRLVHLSIRHRFFVVLLAGLLAIGGLYSGFTLPVDAVPDITTTQVVVNTSAPALAPEEIEAQLTRRLELLLSGLPHVIEMRSISQFGLSQITLVFEDGTDIYFARQLVGERLAEADQQLPPGASSPSLAPVATGLGEIYYVFVESESLSLMERRSLLDWKVKPRLRTVPGVIEVNTFGGHVKQYQVLADPYRLQAYGVSLERLEQALRQNNQNAGGSYVHKEDEQQLVQAVGLVESLDDLRNIVLLSNDGVPVLVKDVATVSFGAAPRQGTITRNGQGEAVAAIAVMLMGENSRTVTERVKQRVAEIQHEMPPGVKLVGFLDRTRLVNETLHTAGENLLHGGVLVVLVLFLFLLQLRAGLIVSSIIPMAMLFALIGMRYLGISANLMSLGAIDFGIVVDAAVIIVENCVRRLAERHHHLGRALSCQERLAVIEEGVVEVRQASQFGELIIIAAYLPVLSLTGVEGKMFRPMGMTVILALLGAVLLSATLVPALCAYFLSEDSERENPFLEKLRLHYRKALHRAIPNRATVLGVALGTFLLACLAFPHLGAEFLPKLDEGAIAINPGYLPGISVETAIERATLVEQYLLAEFPDEIDEIATRIGRPDIATDPMLLSQHDIFISLEPRRRWTRASSKEELVGAIEASLVNVPGMKMSFTQPIEMRMNELSQGVGIRADLGVKLFGPDMAMLGRKAVEVADVMRAIPGNADVSVETMAGLPTLKIHTRRRDLARYGINVDDVNQVVATAIGGAVVGQVLEGEEVYDIFLRYQEPFRKDKEAIAKILVESSSGQLAPLSALATIESSEGPVQVSRESAQRRVVVQANVRGRDLGSFVEEVQQTVEQKVKLPPGYHIEWSGQYEHLQSGRARLAIIVPITFCIIFLLLYLTYGNAFDALRVFTGIPFAITGGIFALFLRGMPFSMSAGVGFIALSGIAVLADMVMVQTIRLYLDQGIAPGQAIEMAALNRLRPVLMTAAVAAIGFLPMALSSGTGAEVQKPLATVVIGGLISSTLLTLLVLPALYSYLQDRKEAPTVD